MQGSNLGLLHCRQILYHLSHQGCPQDLLKLTPKKYVLFIIGDWNAKVGGQEIPRVIGNRQDWSWGTKWSRAKANKVLPRERTGHNTLLQQHRWWLCTWTSHDYQPWNQIDYILCSKRWRSSVQSVETRPGIDCGSHHELLIAKFRFKLKKVRKPPVHSGIT